ncbi:DUF4160 domain-containing protein [Duganella fentianensis]|uniref:DUF4160 domain-containing protein n=1 Tax=Duganella fentianensis TaxID=2692177 RepID=UPI0032B11E90
MPQVLRYKGYRFFFYSNDAAEPPHVHVSLNRSTAKFWLESVTLVRHAHFTPQELREIERIILRHKLEFLRRWNEHFYAR